MTNYNESDNSSGTASVLPLDNISDYGSGDNFGGTALDAGWSSLQIAPVTNADASVDGFLLLKNTGNTSGQDRGIKRAFAPAGDFEATTKILVTPLVTDFQWAGLFVGAADPSDAAGGNRLSLELVIVSADVKFKFKQMVAGIESVTVAASIISTFGVGLVTFPIWLRLKRVGSTITAGISFDGVQYQDHPTTKANPFTIATCGLYIGESSASQNVRTTFEYLKAA